MADQDFLSLVFDNHCHDILLSLSVAMHETKGVVVPKVQTADSYAYSYGAVVCAVHYLLNKDKFNL